MAQWWVPREQAAQAARAPPPPPPTTDPDNPRLPRRELTSLGLLRRTGHPLFRYYEMRYLQFVKACLTTDWPCLQGGSCPATLAKWLLIFQWMELDRKAVLDMVLLAHCGLPGRSEANRVLWELLSIWALKEEYVDISRKTSTLVWEARRHFERPPQADRDCLWWEPRHYVAPRLPQWSPLAVEWHPVTLEYLPTYPDINGDPQPPPACWAPAAGGLWV
jgi:hypothetical protein